MAADFSSLEKILEQILNYTASVDPELRGSLNEELASEQIEEMTRDFGIQLPAEVENLYKWHNGMRSENRGGNHRFLYYHDFLSLNDALELCQYFLESEGMEELRLLPLFEFEGEFYATCCNTKKQDSAPIYFLYHDESIVYNSLTAMLSSILECYETKAYIPLLDTDGDPVFNEQLAAQIKLKWNPIRGRLYAHP